MLKILLPLLLAVIIGLSACASFEMQTKGMLKERVVTYQLQRDSQEVIYIPMHHIGKKEFYEHVKTLVTTYQEQGYLVFYESIAYVVSDSLERDRYDKKYRYLTGAHPNFQKATEGKIPADSIAKKSGKIAMQYQPSYEKLGVFMPKAYKADIPKRVLIDAFERTYGPIVLTECDTMVRLDRPYICQGASNKQRNLFDKQFVMQLREQHLAKQIDFSKAPKIVVIFGQAHYKNTLKELRKLDPTWQEKRIFN